MHFSPSAPPHSSIYSSIFKSVLGSVFRPESLLPLLMAGLTLTLVAPLAFSAPATKTVQIAQSAASGRDKNAPKKRAPNAEQQQDSEFVNFSQWKEVASFIDDMAARNGFDRAALNQLFSSTKYVESAIKLIKPAPAGRPKNWVAYRLRFVEPIRINSGVQFWNEYEGELARAEIEYGVPAEIIVAIIGVETIYGRNTGNFRVMDAITTLAFDYPATPNRDARMQFFRRELENTLLFARESNIDPFSLLGSYAGAIGLPQFMPSSIRQYAIDFDGDGKIDLRNSPVDAIGSVAHFLSVHGWRRGLPLVYPATVPDEGSTSAMALRSAPATASATESNTVPVVAASDAVTAAPQWWQTLLDKGLEATWSIDEIRAAGVIAPIDNADTGMKYGLIDLQNGNGPTEYWLASGNFFAITKYNRSYFYAMSVIDLSRAIRAARTGSTD
jgi:membrane-bound lytic murein transglycosylase B